MTPSIILLLVLIRRLAVLATDVSSSWFLSTSVPVFLVVYLPWNICFHLLSTPSSFHHPFSDPTMDRRLSVSSPGWFHYLGILLLTPWTFSSKFFNWKSSCKGGIIFSILNFFQGGRVLYQYFQVQSSVPVLPSPPSSHILVWPSSQRFHSFYLIASGICIYA